MKWIVVLLLLGLLGYGVYVYLNSFTKSEGSPYATVDAYRRAALANDAKAVRALCANDAAADAALRISADIRAAASRNLSVDFKSAQNQPPHAVYTAEFGSEIIDVELLDEGGGYRIVKIKSGDI